MASTKDKLIKGIWADDALTSIPVTPVQGESYRDDSLVTDATQKEGQAFDTLVSSARWNAMLRFIHLLGKEVEDFGLAGYSDQIDYTSGSFVRGSDGLMYRCVVDNGPSSSVEDPVDALGSWETWPRSASEGVAGVVRRANDIEFGERQNKHIFVSPNQIPKFATVSEGAAGASETVWMSPARVKAYVDSKLGTAASRNVGTASDQIPLNSDLGTASKRNVGTSTGQLVLREKFGSAAFKSGSAAGYNVGTSSSNLTTNSRVISLVESYGGLKSFTRTTLSLPGDENVPVTAPSGYRFLFASTYHGTANLNATAINSSGTVVTLRNDSSLQATASIIWAK